MASSSSGTRRSTQRVVRSMEIVSPSRTRASGPASAASGETSPTTMPLLTSPESCPSVTTATLPVSPAPSSAKTGREAMPMPGVPLGPRPRSTSTCPGSTSPARNPSSASCGLSYTLAGPVNDGGRSSSTASLTIPVAGASEPRTRTIVGPRPSARSGGRITSGSVGCRSVSSSPRVRPVMVRAPVCSSSRSCHSTPEAPPAASNSSMEYGPFGRTAASSGTLSASRS